MNTNAAPPVTSNSIMMTLKIMWGALLFSQVMLVGGAYLIQSQGVEAPSDIKNFAEAAQTPLFKIFSATAVVCLVLSRYLPGFLFKQSLEKLPSHLQGEEKDIRILQNFFTSFIVGMTLLEFICILGFMFFNQYRFMPLLLGFFIFSFLNAFIRFSMKHVILKSAEDILNPHKHLKVY